MYIKQPPKEYALYYGDKFIMIGTIQEVAKKMGITVGSARHLATPGYLKSASRESKRLLRLN